MSWITEVGNHCDKMSKIHASSSTEALRYNFNECFKLRKYFPYDPIVEISKSGQFALIWDLFMRYNHVLSNWVEYDKTSVLSVKPYKNDISFSFQLLNVSEPIKEYIHIYDLTEDHFPKSTIRIFHIKK